MNLIPVEQSEQAHGQLAGELHGLLAERAAEGRPLVLGLATGNTMVELYAELVQLLRDEPVDLSQLSTFNLDEYLDLEAGDPRSFQSFMVEHLFEPLDLDPGRCHFPDAQLALRDPKAACRAYSGLIQEAGGIDLQLLGLGRNGHVAFNEPGSPVDGMTRVVPLHPFTRQDAAPNFGSLEAVPERAITMGLAEIRAARRLRLLAFGKPKAEALASALGAKPDPQRPLSSLLLHPDLMIWADASANGQESSGSEGSGREL